MVVLKKPRFMKLEKIFLNFKALPSTSVSQFSRSVVSDSLRPIESQHTRPPCPSPTPEVYPNSCPLSRWCPPTISSSVVPFSCPQSFPASRSFPMSLHTRWRKYWSFSFSISPSDEYSGLISWIGDGLVWSPCCPRDSQESSPARFESINYSLSLAVPLKCTQIFFF